MRLCYLRGWLSILFHLLSLALPSTGQCDTSKVGINLEECPLPELDVDRREEGSFMSLDFVTYNWSLPAVDPDTGNVLDGTTWSIRVKTFTQRDQPPTSPVAPVMRWRKGDKVILTLRNSLDRFLPIPSNDTAYIVNIHTHGLHVASHEDDPRVRIYPGQTKIYNFNILSTHASGFNWYHPHIHGLGEFQTLASAAGPLIIEDTGQGLEIPLAIEDVEERILHIQRIFPGKLLKLSQGYVGPFDFFPEANPRSKVNDPLFRIIGANNLQLSSESVNYTLVNGFLNPNMNLKRRQWYRIKLLFVSGEDPKEMIADGRFRLSKPCTTKLIAKDGVFLKIPRNIDLYGANRILLHPGSRAEFLILCDLENESELDLILETTNTRGVVQSSISVLTIKLAENEIESQIPLKFTYHGCLPSYLPDMRKLDIAAFPPPEIDAAHIRESTNFYVNVENTLDIDISPFAINGEVFKGFSESPSNISLMFVNQVYQMRLVHGTHPLHIHVNHFQLQEDIEDGTGYHQEGDFVDTIATPCPPEGCRLFPPRDPTEEVLIRFYAHKFTGLVLLHCHNFDHSDTGALALAYILRKGEEEIEPVVAFDTCDKPIQLMIEANVPIDQPTSQPSKLITKMPSSSPSMSPTQTPMYPPSSYPSVSPIMSSIIPTVGFPNIETKFLEACILYPNAFFWGVADLGTTTGSSLLDCAASCLIDRRCHFFTFSDNSDYCEIWSNNSVSLQDLVDGAETVLNGLYHTHFCERSEIGVSIPGFVPSASSSPTPSPSEMPTNAPSSFPSNFPTALPTKAPSGTPTRNPTPYPSSAPSNRPTLFPSTFPTHHPSLFPTPNPSELATSSPSLRPTSSAPSARPTFLTISPSDSPSSHEPTFRPSESPLLIPTKSPTYYPTAYPTKYPSPSPSQYPSVSPTHHPTLNPSTQPSLKPTETFTKLPTVSPTNSPLRFTGMPINTPSEAPSGIPLHSKVTSSPSFNEVGEESLEPTASPASTVVPIPPISTEAPTENTVFQGNLGESAEGIFQFEVLYFVLGFLIVLAVVALLVTARNAYVVQKLRKENENLRNPP